MKDCSRALYFMEELLCWWILGNIRCPWDGPECTMEHEGHPWMRIQPVDEGYPWVRCNVKLRTLSLLRIFRCPQGSFRRHGPRTAPRIISVFWWPRSTLHLKHCCVVMASLPDIRLREFLGCCASLGRGTVTIYKYHLLSLLARIHIIIQ